MAEISASMVMDLRQRTGLGMMECKKALTEAASDTAKAEELLRIRSGAKASKAASRVAAEGVVGLYVAGRQVGGARRGELRNRLRREERRFPRVRVRSRGHHRRDNPADLAALGNAKLASGDTVEARRVALVQKIGENITIRRFARKAARPHRVVCPRCQDRRARRLTGGEDTLGKDLAMHVAASKPVAVSGDQVPADVVAKGARSPRRAPPSRESPPTSSRRWSTGPWLNSWRKSRCWPSLSSKETARRPWVSSSGAGRDGPASCSTWSAKASRRGRTTSRPKSPPWRRQGAFRDRVGPITHGAR